MPQPNKGSAAPGAPTSQPISDKSGAKSDPHIMLGKPGGTGTRGK